MRERFWSAYNLELRQIFRQWSYWLILALLGLYIISIFNTFRGYSAEEILLSGASRNAIGLSTLVVLFLTAFSAGRARRSRMDVLEATLPTGSEISLGRWAAVVTASAPLIVPPLGLALALGPVESFMRGLPVFLLESALALVLTIVLVWAIEATAGIKRWMFPVLAMLWVAAIAASVMSSGWALAPWLSQLNFTRFGAGYYVEGWGRLAIGSFPLLLNIFHAGCIVLLIGLGVRGIERRRVYRTSMRTYVVMGVGGLIALAGYLLYGSYYIETRAQASNQIYGVYTPTQGIEYVAADFAVSRYDIALDLSGTPAFTVSMDVRNDADEPRDSFVFSLMLGLEITESSLPFVHDRKLVTFTTETPLAPGETFTLDLQYSGSAARYMAIYAMTPIMEAFATPDGIYLPYSAQWYPRAGVIEPNEENVVYIQTGEFDAPAAFTLRVTGTEMPLVSNLPRTGEDTFSASDVTWVNLYGAPELEVQEPVEGYEVVTTKYQYELLRGDLESGLGRVQPLVSRYFPGKAMLVYLYPRFTSLSSPSNYTPHTTGDTITLHEFWRAATGSGWFYEAGTYETGVYSRALLFFGSGMARSALIENVSQFVFVQIQHDGDADAMRAALAARIASTRPVYVYTDAEGNPAEPPAEVIEAMTTSYLGYAHNYDVAWKLVDVYAAHGTDGVAELLLAMRDEGDTLGRSLTADTVAWIEAWVAENLADA